jgi:uncharacterized repeat protein (TIGR03809 family)
MSAWLTTQALERTAHKWRSLAERRQAHLIELYQSGRWKRYCTEAQMLDSIRKAVAHAERWAVVAPRAVAAVPGTREDQEDGLAG